MSPALANWRVPLMFTNVLAPSLRYTFPPRPTPLPTFTSTSCTIKIKIKQNLHPGKMELKLNNIETYFKKLQQTRIKEKDSNPIETELESRQGYTKKVRDSNELFPLISLHPFQNIAQKVKFLLN